MLQWVNSSAFFQFLFRSIAVKFNLTGKERELNCNRNWTGTGMEREWNGNGTGMELEWNRTGMERKWNKSSIDGKWKLYLGLPACVQSYNRPSTMN